MSYRSFNKIEEELSNDKPNLEIIKKELDKIKEEISDLEWQNQDLDDEVSELESEIYELKEDLKELKQPQEDHNLDDYFMDKILQELVSKWRYSSTKLEQKLKESDLI
jgi:chromosome segregation ATPase